MSKIPKRYLLLDEIGFVGTQDRTEAQVKEDAELTSAYIKAYKARMAEKEAKKAARKKKHS